MANEILKNSFLSTIFCVLLLYSAHSEDNLCVEETACLCRLNDDRIIDISHVITDDLPLNINKGNLTYYFYPCKNYLYNEDNRKRLGLNITIDDKLNECIKGSSVCLHNATDQRLINLGEVQNVKFTAHSPKALVYTKGNVTTIIKLDCTPDDKIPYLEIDDKKNPDKLNHYLILFSNRACPLTEQHGLSTGSTLLILFSTGFGIYFLGGALVLHLLRGAQGKEMIPNLDFWVDLPHLVKDGMIFLLSGCNPLSISAVETYDRI